MLTYNIKSYQTAGISGSVFVCTFMLFTTCFLSRTVFIYNLNMISSNLHSHDTDNNAAINLYHFIDE